MELTQIDREIEALQQLQSKWVDAVEAAVTAMYKHGHNSIEASVACCVANGMEYAMRTQNEYITDLTRRVMEG